MNRENNSQFTTQLADQLTSVNKATLQEDWSYDKAGNAVLTQTNNESQKGTFNQLNQLMSLDAGDRLKVRGMTSEPANVYVNHQVATMVDATHFEHEIPVVQGSNTIRVEAQDGSGNRKTQKYQVSVTSPPVKTFSYDLNGNMTSDGTRTYSWDAANRLTKISYSGGGSSEFAYNGLSQRTRITEKDSSSAIIKDSRFMWAGGNQPAQERDNTGATVIKHFYSQGVYIPDATAPLNKLFYTKDHLQSIRDVTDASGNLVARYAFTASGKRTKLSGSIDIDVGYTGHFHHLASGLILTQFRPYEAEYEIFISRDPIGEMHHDGPNLYTYVLNNSVNKVDPTGLFSYPGTDIPITTNPLEVPAKLQEWMFKNNIYNNPKNGYDPGHLSHCVSTCILASTNAGLGMLASQLTELPGFTDAQWGDYKANMRGLYHGVQHSMPPFNIPGLFGNAEDCVKKCQKDYCE